MPRMRTTLLLLAFVLDVSLPGSLHAQQAFRFNHLTVDDVLTQGDISSIVQDRQGFMWLGASDQGGVMKYDGYGFTIYKHDPFDSTSLSSDRPFTIIEGREGGLWMGTWDGGLNRFDLATERFTHYRHDPADPNSLSTDFPAFLHEGREGQLWILSIEFAGPAINAYLDRLDPATGRVTRYRHDPADPQSLSQDLVTFIVVGVMVYPAFHEDREGVIWVGTVGGGLNRFDPAAGVFTHYRHDPADAGSLSHDDVHFIFEDQADRLWIGTQGGGLNLLDRETGTFTHYRHDPIDPNSLAHDVAAVTWEDQNGGLWVTTKGGLDRLDPATGTFTHYRHDPAAANTLGAPEAIPFYEEDDGDLWLTSITPLRGQLMQAHLEHLDPATGVVTRLRADPEDPGSLSRSALHTVTVDDAGLMWVGTIRGSGLHWTDTHSSTLTHYKHEPGNPNSLLDNVVWAMTEDHAGVLWVSTQNGLNRVDRAAKTVTHFVHDPADPRSVSHNEINFITG